MEALYGKIREEACVEEKERDERGRTYREHLERSKEPRSFKRLKFGIHEERRFSYFDPTILAKTGVGKNLVSVSNKDVSTFSIVDMSCAL
jgi:hypothetical protein